MVWLSKCFPGMRKDCIWMEEKYDWMEKKYEWTE